MADRRLESVTLYPWHGYCVRHPHFSLRYFLTNEVDPKTIWTGICEGCNGAITWCKTFFSNYVDNSVRRILVLCPKEYEDRRMLNYVTLLLKMWRKLIKEADLTVL